MRAKPPTALRVVRPGAGDDAAAPPPPPTTGPRIKSFTPAPPGWLAWFVDHEDSADDLPRWRSWAPLVGYAVIETAHGDIVAPMIAHASLGYRLADPREATALLCITAPGEDAAAKVAAAEALWEAWVDGFNRVHGESPVSCEHFNAGLCAARRADRVGHAGVAACECGCHAEAHGAVTVLPPRDA